MLVDLGLVGGLEGEGLLENEPHSTTKLINGHQAHKALTTRGPPSGHLSQAFGGGGGGSPYACSSVL